MGWGRTLLLGDIGNRLDIGDAEQDIRRLRDQLREKGRLDRSQESRLDELEQDVAGLKLCLASLSRLLTTKGILTPQDLDGFSSVIDRDDDA